MRFQAFHTCKCQHDNSHWHVGSGISPPVNVIMATVTNMIVQASHHLSESTQQSPIINMWVKASHHLSVSTWQQSATCGFRHLTTCPWKHNSHRHESSGISSPVSVKTTAVINMRVQIRQFSTCQCQHDNSHWHEGSGISPPASVSVNTTIVIDMRVQAFHNLSVLLLLTWQQSATCGFWHLTTCQCKHKSSTLGFKHFTICWYQHDNSHQHDGSVS